MNAYEQHRAAQPGASAFDPGPSIQEIDQELQEISGSIAGLRARIERPAA